LGKVENDPFQELPLAPQFLGTLAVLPDGRVFAKNDDFG
jgi:hypothetical protein